MVSVAGMCVTVMRSAFATVELGGTLNAPSAARLIAAAVCWVVHDAGPWCAATAAAATTDSVGGEAVSVAGMRVTVMRSAIAVVGMRGTLEACIAARLVAAAVC